MRTTLAAALTALVSSCAHLTPSSPSPSSVVEEGAGHVYDGSVGQVQQRVAQFFAKQGVTMERWEHDPNVLVSRVKERGVAIAKGEYRSTDQNPTPAVDHAAGESAPFSIDADTEQVRTSSFSDTTRTGMREFAQELRHEGPSPGAFDHYGRDRAQFIERDWWEARFTPLSPKRTRVVLLHNHGSDWQNGADRSYVSGTFTGRLEGNTTTAPQYLDRDLVKEEALAAELERSAVVDIMGQALLEQIAPVEVPAPPAPTHTEPSTSTAAVQPEAACGTNVGPLTLEAGAVLLVADPEGTAEAGAGLLRVVCVALARHVPVTVALSISAYEQARVNAFLRSEGTEADLTTLLAGSFWGRLWQDGRSSSATIALLQGLRALARAGQQVVVLAADADLRGNERTAFITARLQEHRRAYPDRLVIGFLSNTLISRKAGTAWDPDASPIGYRLATAGVPVKSFDVAYQTGTQWSCHLFKAGALRCGTWPLVPGPRQFLLDRTDGLHPFDAPSKDGFDGLWWVGKVNASPPALGVAKFHDEGDLRGTVLTPSVYDTAPPIF